MRHADEPDREELAGNNGIIPKREKTVPRRDMTTGGPVETEDNASEARRARNKRRAERKKIRKLEDSTHHGDGLADGRSVDMNYEVLFDSKVVTANDSIIKNFPSRVTSSNNKRRRDGKISLC